MKGRQRCIVPTLGLGLMLWPGCGQQPAPVLPSDQSASGTKLPFDRAPGSGGVSPTQAFAAVIIPAGTSFVIRLQAPLSSATSHVGDMFQGLLDEPVVVGNQTVAAPGAVLTGTVTEAKPAASDQPGYLRLTLASVVVDSHALPLHSSSIFAKGTMRRSGSQPQADEAHQLFRGEAGLARSDARFSTGRRLTFHLIDPLPLKD